MTLKIYMEDISNGLCPLNKSELQILKDSLTVNDIKELENEAVEIFKYPLQTITIYPKQLSDDIHEYESISIYSWPNPETSDHLPYITRDGYINRDNLGKDKLALRTMSYVCHIAGIMYFITHDKKYYEVIKKQITSFFINEKTRMNPSLKHGQAHPGINDGQPGGIIDFGVSFGYTLSILDALREEDLLEKSLVDGLSEWLCAFINWLETHPNALIMKERKNNHCLVYDYLLLICARFTENDVFVNEVCERFEERIKNQIEEDGAMPLELARPKSRSYTMMNTKLILSIAKYTNNLVGLHLPQVKAMMYYYYNYGNGNKKWEMQQTQDYYKFYDYAYLYQGVLYFQMDRTMHIFKEDIEESKFSYLLYKNVLNIIIEKREKND